MGKAQKRVSKQAAKHVAMYRMVFGLPQPYNIIMHGGFIQHCLDQKVSIHLDPVESCIALEESA
jgi:hypothetical protein